MPLDLRGIGAFLKIVSAGSLGRAAEALNVTQPALSRTVKRLEEQLGAPLFERHAKGMQLTAIGHALLPHAELLQHEAAHAVEEIDAMRGLAKGEIRVGAVGSIASLTLPLAISAVLAKWPNLHVVVIEEVWDRLASALTRHEIDLALGVAEDATEDIVEITECRWNDRSHIVAATGHPLRGKPGLRLADTLGHQWAVPPRGTAPFEHMSAAFRANGLQAPYVVVETRSITVLKSLVTRCGFLSWMAESIYDAERRADLIDALQIDGVTGTRTLTAFKRRHGRLPGPSLKLLEELRLLTT